MNLTPSIVAAGTGATLARATIFAPFMQAACEQFHILDPRDVAAFLAQTGHESGHLIFTKEIWGPTAAQKQYEPPSQKAKDLGNTQAGDGVRFCGRGLIQITGRRNYTLAAVALDLDLLNHSELLEQPEHAAMSAGWYWWNNKLSGLATAGKFTTLTERINGGLNGFTDRQALYRAAQKALGIA
ncbi:TPA: glycoside hydrolase family 19 protein [Burkholderia cenocepacia]|uniref:glycoside hydrolase family 19 protein n=1 Tax=Burkholderia cenocepacia TaxID=95486 RepID=UPI001B91D493|nr:glycoside hydrolase family 19 protein [Burkholderia cenocepacia]MBR8096303.1 glycoside hydrolase family 19 protein [Burkholderia cenocepacia]HEP6426872.1 glycoside hydrolase family 19 protein [Burkholderia cenocepacia]